MRLAFALMILPLTPLIQASAPVPLTDTPVPDVKPAASVATALLLRSKPSSSKLVGSTARVNTASASTPNASVSLPAPPSIVPVIEAIRPVAAS